MTTPGQLTISIDEAARLLGISKANAYAQAKQGRIPTVRIGGRILVPVRRLEALVNGEPPGRQPIPETR